MCIEDITENKRLIDTLQQIQKLDTIGKLAGGVAHDFNNILSALSLHVSLLLKDNTITDRLRGEFTMMDTNIQRGINLTKKLLLFGRRETMKLTRIDINSLLSDLIKLLSRILGGNVTINFTPSYHTVFINGDAGMIELAIINLCVNARDAMPQGGTITISTDLINIAHPDICPVKSGAYSKITVEDNGIGLSEEAKKHIFDPFYTTKQYEIGTGLGLSVVYGIVKKHHGHITATSDKETGTRFDILIPEYNDEMAP
jgi:signal transduction histidine kinase